MKKDPKELLNLEEETKKMLAETLREAFSNTKKEMNNKEKAKIILESLEEYIQVNYNFEEFYLKGIINGLEKIDKEKGE